mmetsp:Transcript_17880/g.43750  ORF Transcript_17880/g.43750 Transcript_17880/m.43750 type:complete len:323 (-) Transcript_17880:283-1251(-)
MVRDLDPALLSASRPLRDAKDGVGALELRRKGFAERTGQPGEHHDEVPVRSLGIIDFWVAAVLEVKVRLLKDSLVQAFVEASTRGRRCSDEISKVEAAGDAGKVLDVAGDDARIAVGLEVRHGAVLAPPPHRALCPLPLLFNLTLVHLNHLLPQHGAAGPHRPRHALTLREMCCGVEAHHTVATYILGMAESEAFPADTFAMIQVDLRQHSLATKKCMASIEKASTVLVDMLCTQHARPPSAAESTWTQKKGIKDGMQHSRRASRALLSDDSHPRPSQRQALLPQVRTVPARGRLLQEPTAAIRAQGAPAGQAEEEATCKAC